MGTNRPGEQERRILRLEEDCAFLASRLDKLDEALVFQQEQIDILEKKLALANSEIERLKAMEEAGGIVNTPPPHHNSW